MKVLASLSRVVFSIIVLLALACYLQNTPTVSLANFCASITPEQLITMLSSFNTVSVLFVIILLLGMLPFTRVLEAAWNVIFCASVLALLAIGLYEIGGPIIALPKALYDNDAVNQFCQAMSSYEVPVAITLLIFIAGWLCASACGRVAITAIVSYGLWYAITSFFTYAVQLWANSDSPTMPEALHMVQSTPWIIAAVPGAFFLIYALFMAFFETFINPNPSKRADKKETTNEEMPKPEKEAADATKPAAEEKSANDSPPAADKASRLKPVEPAAKSQPILKITPSSPAQARKLKPSAPATPEKSVIKSPSETAASKAEAKTEKTTDTEPRPKFEDTTEKQEQLESTENKTASEAEKDTAVTKEEKVPEEPRAEAENKA